MLTQSLAIITAMFNNLADSQAPLSGTQRISRRGWAYSVGDWALVVGSNKGVLVETARADFDRLSEALGGSEHRP
jgi:roadblock/LC7 domain-containing protein